jgi:hypothetical protein
VPDFQLESFLEEMKALLREVSSEHADSVSEYVEEIAEDFAALVREPDDALFEELLGQAKVVRGILRVRLSSWSQRVFGSILEFGARVVRSLLLG